MWILLSIVLAYRMDSNFVIKVSLSESLYSKDNFQYISSGVRLPIQWMAPESLTVGCFSEKSDVVNFPSTHKAKISLLSVMTVWRCILFLFFNTLRLAYKFFVLPVVLWYSIPPTVVLWYNLFLLQWSYGITMWEIFTGGRIPYAGVDTHEISLLLESGKRILRPTNTACTDELYVYKVHSHSVVQLTPGSCAACTYP